MRIFSSVFGLGALVGASLALTGCVGGGGDVDPGFQAIQQGNYAQARDILAPLQAQQPHDPYIQLDLGWSYQNLGRMDLAEPLYRGAMADGQATHPERYSNPGVQGQTVAMLACENLRAGLNNPNAC